MSNRLKFTGEMYNKAKVEGISIEDVIREKYKDVLNEDYADDIRSVVSIALQEAGFTKNSTLEQVFNYSQSSQNDDLLFPAYVDETIKVIMENETQTIIYPDLIAQEIMISGTDFKSILLDWTEEENAENLLWQGLEEGSEIPTVSAKLSQTALKIFKNGVSLKETYELMRRIKIDIVSMHFTAVARKLGLQNLHEILYVLINGDGNNNAIPDSMKFKSSAGGITKTDLVDIAVEFNDASKGLTADRYLCTKGAYKSLQNIFMSTDVTQSFAPGASFVFPQNILNGATVYYVRDLPLTDDGKDRMIIFNKSEGVNRIVESGSQISEEENKPSNQTHMMYLTENVGYQKKNINAVAEVVIEPAIVATATASS